MSEYKSADPGAGISTNTRTEGNGSGGRDADANAHTTKVRVNDASGPSGVQGLHHFAWRCRDAEETRHFYEDLIGLPLTHVIHLDHVPSTSEYCPYVHLFFGLDDGSSIAFFDLGDGVSAEPSPNTPAWVNHIALQVADAEALEAKKARLQAGGVEVLGTVDHGFVSSIYFFDPNGLRVELTMRTKGDDVLQGYAQEAHRALAQWTNRGSSAGLGAHGGEGAAVAGSDAPRDKHP